MPRKKRLKSKEKDKIIMQLEDNCINLQNEMSQRWLDVESLYKRCFKLEEEKKELEKQLAFACNEYKVLKQNLITLGLLEDAIKAPKSKRK